MKGIRHSIAAIASVSILASCTPSHQTTEQLCFSNLPTLQAIQSNEVVNDEIVGGYEPYFQDFFNSFKNLQSKSIDTNGNVVLSDLSAEEIAVRDFIFEQINKDMDYSFDSEGNVTSANNPLDFVASLIATTDSSKLVQSFVEAKQQMASAISKDDGHCTYRNEQIQFIREDDSLNILDSFSVALDLAYIPSALAGPDNKVDQTIIVSYDEDPNSSDDEVKTFAGADRIIPENFVASGFSQAKQRQINLTQVSPPQVTFLDEDYLDTKIATFSYAVLNEVCTDGTDDNNIVTCPAGSTTKPVEHPACNDGIDEDGIDGNINLRYDEADESNTRLLHDFTIGDGSIDALNNIKRIKVEVDYPNNEIRVYASKYSDNTIYKAEDESGNPIAQGSDNPNPTSDQLISEPTRCESYNVAKDLSEQTGNVATTFAAEYEDPSYDKIELEDENGDTLLDADGNIVYQDITPLYVFQGTAITERQ